MLDLSGDSCGVDAGCGMDASGCLSCGLITFSSPELKETLDWREPRCTDSLAWQLGLAFLIFGDSNEL